jgi:hypothetical protein
MNMRVDFQNTILAMKCDAHADAKEKVESMKRSLVDAILGAMDAPHYALTPELRAAIAPAVTLLAEVCRGEWRRFP